MSISITCSACQKRLKAKDSLAGKTVACPGCGQKLVLPQLEEAAASFLLDENSQEDAPPPQASTDEKSYSLAPAAVPHPPILSAKKSVASLPPLTMNEPPLWLRHLHWLLILALLPLTFSLLQDNNDNFFSRLKDTLDKAPPQIQQRAGQVFKGLEEGRGSLEDLFAVFPDGKLVGAFLSRRTWTHWAFGISAAVLFLTFIFLLGHGTTNQLHLIGVGLFTATIGIVFLLAVQWLANVSQGVWLHGTSVLVILFYIVKLIGFSYQAALDPENGFVLSFVGYTFGVGFCEEVCKAMPLLWSYRQPSKQGWRGAFLFGLASGAGFGIAEGIMYAGNYYNGVSGPGIYVVRFISCVALHALWTGSVGITLNQNQGLIQQDLSWYEFIPPVFFIVGIPMVLHGLYDTLLKKEMNAGALAVAVLSFLFLAFQISRLHSEDDEEAKQKMFREYKRRRAAM
jgi:RsiW-degrading membrane proteinase PrsW (M82 family)